MPGRLQGPGATPPRQRGVTPGMRATPGHVPAEGLDHRLRLPGGPHRALRGAHRPVPSGPNHQRDTRRTLGRPQGVDLGVTVANADQPGLGTPLGGAADGRQTGEPWLAFLLAEGPRLAPGSRAPTGWANRPRGTRAGVNARGRWTSRP